MSTPVVAVIGGGQLARMMQEEASVLGIHLRALVEAADGAADQVTVDSLVGPAGDEGAVRLLVSGRAEAAAAGTAEGGAGRQAASQLSAPPAPGCPRGAWAQRRADVLTCEHEHQDDLLLRALQAEGVSVHPSPQALLLARDKLAMRRAIGQVGLPQPGWAEAHGTVPEMRRAVLSFAEVHGWPVVLKTPRGGYDGHGVLVVHEAAELESGPAHAWLAAVAGAAAGQQHGEAGGGGSLGGGAVTSLLVEEAVAFTRELAVLVARSPSGEVAAWPVAETVQAAGMCAEVVAPAPGLDPGTVRQAQRVGRTVAERFRVTGVLAVELFCVEQAGRPARLYVNELAMRPHNSGHWTQDGAVTSQFAQHLRAVLDLPLGSTATTAPATVMVNLIGGTRPPGEGALAEALALEPRARVHLYGKSWRPGRKLGHVNLTLLPGGTVQEALERARGVVALLRDGA